MFGRKNKYGDPRSEFLEDSELLKRAGKVISEIADAADRNELYIKEKELNRIIDEAIGPPMKRKDLVDIEYAVSTELGVRNLIDEREGGRDSLLRERNSVFVSAYERIENSL